MVKQRPSKQEKNADSSSLSSSDSDNKKSFPRSKKKKGKCKGDGGILPLPCLNITDRIKSCASRVCCGLPCLTNLNRTCLISYGLLFLLLLGLLYFFGGHLLSLMKSILSLSMFKSTNAIVSEALDKYNADKLGLPDYALESAGGSILCSSDTYYSRSGALYSIFGVPLWYHSSSPREVIQPDVQPGKCWAMDGDKGYVMVKLSMPIIVTAVSLEHIPAQVAPTGRLDSAPKEFAIVGKELNMESPDVHLGRFLYRAEKGHSIQTFQIKDPYCTRQSSTEASYYTGCGPNQQVFRIVELRVLSNQGNRDYTCLYRLRVHGRPLVPSR